MTRHSVQDFVKATAQDDEARGTFLLRPSVRPVHAGRTDLCYQFRARQPLDLSRGNLTVNDAGRDLGRTAADGLQFPKDGLRVVFAAGLNDDLDR
jgi:hypothetical protein